MSKAIVDYFRCPEHFVQFEVQSEMSQWPGFFRSGPDIKCYGHYSVRATRRKLPQGLPDVHGIEEFDGDRVRLPFAFSEVVDNLRLERYRMDGRYGRGRITERSPLNKLYYFVRPILPISVRKHFQRFHLQGWNKIDFPQWPVDFTVESLMEHALKLALKTRPTEKIPFIWFWPGGARSC